MNKEKQEINMSEEEKIFRKTKNWTLALAIISTISAIYYSLASFGLMQLRNLDLNSVSELSLVDKYLIEALLSSNIIIIIYSITAVSIFLTVLFYIYHSRLRKGVLVSKIPYFLSIIIIGFLGIGALIQFSNGSVTLQLIISIAMLIASILALSNLFKLPNKKQYEMTRIKEIQIGWKYDQLWESCMLASIAQAIMVAQQPVSSIKHSWDGINYSVQDHVGIRGTITFKDEIYIGAFRNDKSDRLSGVHKQAEEYFAHAPLWIYQTATTETFQYLLDNVEGNRKPVITTGFWGDKNGVHGLDTFEDMLKHGGCILARQMANLDVAIGSWAKYYEMSPQQILLLKSIYARLIATPDKKMVLNAEEIRMIGAVDEERKSSSISSFEEIGISWS